MRNLMPQEALVGRLLWDCSLEILSRLGWGMEKDGGMVVVDVMTNDEY